MDLHDKVRQRVAITLLCQEVMIVIVLVMMIGTAVTGSFLMCLALEFYAHTGWSFALFCGGVGAQITVIWVGGFLVELSTRTYELYRLLPEV
jgi:hypothetical protein